MTNSLPLQIKNKTKQLKWWQIALISVAVSFLGALSGGNPSRNKQRKLYRNQQQAPWAPPAWVFAPAWTLNNFFLLLGLRRILVNDKTDQKRAILMVQAAIWLIFFSFNYVYFKKKSPVLAAIWTKADAVLALTGLLLSVKKDRKVALSYLPLLLWTSFASTLADYQALKNADPLLQTEPLEKHLG